MSNRRRFLGSGALAGLAALTRPVTGAEPTPAPSPSPAAKATAAPRAAVTVSVPFPWEDATLDSLQAAMQSGTLTSRLLTRAYLRRIDELDRRGPTLRHVIELNPDAVRIAGELDLERKASGARGPLHGIPVLLKDNVGTAYRMTTTAGSMALSGLIVTKDAFVARRLREAGAVLLGKANMSEWANFRSSHSSSGWSSRGGQARNPYALDCNPCGSSSGSGAAVSVNLCALAIGTETDGSIVCPASANGIVGIKPTLGLVSRAGIIPLAHSQDTAGPMARTVKDAARVLAVIQGADLDDQATVGGRGAVEPDYLRFLDPKGLEGARIGVVRKLFGFNEGVDRLMETAIADLKRLGAEIVDPVEIPHLGDYEAAEQEVLLYEFKADLNTYLAGLGALAPVHSLAEVIAYNEAHREQVMPFFGQDLLVKSQAKGPLTEQAYVDALDKCRRLARTEGLEPAFAKHQLDALIAPTGGPAWKTDLVNGDHFSGGSSSPAAVAGTPAITVPAGFVRGLPVGLTFMGRAWSEAALIRFAYAYEQGTLHRKPPRLLPTIV
jgi:amidase